MSLVQPNFFQFPNVIADELMRFLTPSEFVCFVVIIRKTRGWNKQADAISLSQFQELTGIKSKRTIMRALHRLCADEVGLVTKVCEPRRTTVYRLGPIFYVKKCTRDDIAKIAIALDEQKTPAGHIPGAINNPTIDISINTGKQQKEKRASAQVKGSASPRSQQERRPRSTDGVNPEIEKYLTQLNEACKP